MSKSKKKTPKLPKLLNSKIYKTGQTRGADDDVIYQNRVNRNNTVLIPYAFFESCKVAPDSGGAYENGFIVLINPEDYFETKGIDDVLREQGLEIGQNALIFYYSRDQWNTYNPHTQNLNVATSRTSPLGGQYVARVPATTSSADQKIREGFNTSQLKGAGIRVYEYASSEVIKQCRVQLEYIFWKCIDSKEVAVEQGMTEQQADERRQHIENSAKALGVDDDDELAKVRILNSDGNTICPLCLEEISANGFFSKVIQAEGREVSDLTVTQLNLFHIEELRTGRFNHRPYNLGWGHHHCNIVTKDSGIDETLRWMSSVLERNREYGFDFNQTD